MKEEFENVLALTKMMEQNLERLKAELDQLAKDVNELVRISCTILAFVPLDACKAILDELERGKK